MVLEILFENENLEIRLFQEISLIIVVKNQLQKMIHLVMDDKTPIIKKKSHFSRK
jgi:hypothetical protein